MANANLEAIEIVVKSREADFELSADDRQKLSLFTGWGACATVFDLAKQGWQKTVRDRLQHLMTEEEYEEAFASTFNAHYTSPAVIEAIWGGLLYMGFGGNPASVLEAGCGTGRFIEYAPPGLQNLDWVGIERDIIPAQIAQLLHPEARILNQRFQDFQVQQGLFDLAIGNVPFGDIRIEGLNIHNFFIRKMVELVRPEGLVAVITSTGTLDSETSQAFRMVLSEKMKVKLVCAVRLPSNTFKEENTEVSTDLLVFQKLPADISASSKEGIDRTWIPSQSMSKMKFVSDSRTLLEDFLPYGGEFNDFNWHHDLIKKRNALNASPEVESFKLNGYYLQYPENLLGKLSVCELYGNGRLALTSDGRNVPEAIVEKLKAFEDCYTPMPSERVTVTDTDIVSIPLNQFFWRKGELIQRTEFGWKIVEAAVVERVSEMLSLYEVLNSVIEAQKLDDEDNLARWRSNLNLCYDEWVAKFNYLNAPQNIEVLGTDPRYYLLMALEKRCDNKDKDSVKLKKSKQKIAIGHFQKADIFFQRTASPKINPTSAKTIEDAIVYSLNKSGRLDTEYMAWLRSTSETGITEELSQSDLAFFDPAIERWVLAEEYLSGNVRQKLRAAVRAEHAKNIEALEAVQPKYLLPNATGQMRAEVALRVGEELCDLNIDAYFQVKLGSTWIAPQIYGDFAESLLQHKVVVTYDRPPIAAFGVVSTDAAILSDANTNIWGVTGVITFLDLLEKALGQKDPVIKDPPKENADGSTTTKTNVEETEKARAKLSEIKIAFQNWLWQDVDRAETITREYNQRFNCYVPRQYRGEFLELPGCNPNFKWRPHQKNAIWRGIQDLSTLLAHTVGAGKTAVMIAIIMELRRLGLAKKPMLAVLNSTLSGVVDEFRRLYPYAKLKIADEKSLSPANRKRFCTEIATNDWDCVIITHTQFRQGISLSPETTIEFLEVEKRMASEYLETFTEGRLPESVKRAAKTIERIEAQISAAIAAAEESQDKVIYLEQTGVDALFVDESQQFKNLPFHSRRDDYVAGLPKVSFFSKSKGGRITSRAFDCYMKVKWLQASGRRVIFATGTPVSNSLAEAWTMMRYLAQPMLEEAGIDHFDACLAAFFNISSSAEQTPTGYKVRTRCRGIDNVQEFMALWRTFVDIQSAKMLKLPVPNHEIIPVNCPASPEQVKYMDHLIQRLNTIAGQRVQKGDDNALVIYGDARAALGVDLRLRWAEAQNFVDSKLNACAMNVFRIWQASTPVKGAQAIFCNFSSPKGGGFFDAYHGLRDTLVAFGMPRSEIAFIHDYKTADKKKKLFAKINAGDVRLVIGSTSTLGTGTNIQRLLLAIHQLDCPWRPSDIEQELGRMLRQHNLFENTFVFRYVTEGVGNKPGFDSYIWGIILSKLQSFNCLMAGEFTGRSSEDLDPFVASAATMMAIASGDDRIKRLIDVERDINSLLIQQKGFQEQQQNNTMRVGQTVKEIDKLCEIIIPRIKEDLAAAKKALPNVMLRRKKYGKSKEQKDAMVEHLFELRKEALAVRGNPTEATKFDLGIGKFGEFDLQIDLNKQSTELFLVGKESYLLPYSSRKDINESLDLKNICSLIETTLNNKESALENARKNLKALNNAQSSTFSRADELVQLLAEKADLDEQLNPQQVVVVDDEAPSPSSSTRAEESEGEDEGSIPFALAKSPCIYRGIESDILVELQDLLENTTPEWLPSVSDSCKALAQKLEETLALHIDEPTLGSRDDDDEIIDVDPADIFAAAGYEDDTIDIDPESIFWGDDDDDDDNDDDDDDDDDDDNDDNETINVDPADIFAAAGYEDDTVDVNPETIFWDTEYDEDDEDYDEGVSDETHSV
jgi:N12 class adenine-specific DNA methylase